MCIAIETKRGNRQSARRGGSPRVGQVFRAGKGATLPRTQARFGAPGQLPSLPRKTYWLYDDNCDTTNRRDGAREWRNNVESAGNKFAAGKENRAHSIKPANKEKTTIFITATRFTIRQSRRSSRESRLSTKLPVNKYNARPKVVRASSREPTYRENFCSLNCGFRLWLVSLADGRAESGDFSPSKQSWQ